MTDSEMAEQIFARNKIVNETLGVDLTVDGYAGEQTQSLLFSENAVRNLSGVAYLDVVEETESTEQ